MIENYTVFLDCRNQFCKMTILLKAIYRLNVISIRLPMAFFHRTRNLYGLKRPQIAKTILGGQGNRAGGTSLVVQWLRLHALNVGAPGLVPDQRTRPHMQQLRVTMLQLRFTCHNLEFMCCS